jgi:hypothetical protein
LDFHDGYSKTTTFKSPTKTINSNNSLSGIRITEPPTPETEEKIEVMMVN